MTSPTRDHQWVLDVDGVDLVIGAGSKYRVASTIGLFGAPAVKAQDEALHGFDGAWAGVDRLETREIGIEIGIEGDYDADPETYDARLQELGEALAPRAASIAFEYQILGRVRRFYGRPRGFAIIGDDAFHMGAALAVARIICPDPLIYDADVTTSASISGSGSVMNGGNYPVWPEIVATPSGSSMTITNETDDELQMTLSGLSAGQSYVLNTRNRTITRAGVDEYDVLGFPPNWVRLLAGSNSITVTGGTVVFVYRGAYSTG